MSLGRHVCKATREVLGETAWCGRTEDGENDQELCGRRLFLYALFHVPHGKFKLLVVCHFRANGLVSLTYGGSSQGCTLTRVAGSGKVVT